MDLSFPEINQIRLPEGYSRLTLLPLAVALVTVGSAAAYSSSIDTRSEDIPGRATFIQFPLFHQGWLGRETSLDTEVLDSLQLTDHISDQLMQIGIPFLGLPGLTVATGLAGSSPVGVQVISGRYREDVMIEAGRIIEAASTPPSPIDPA